MKPMDLSRPRPRPLRLGRSGAFFTAQLFDGAIHISGIEGRPVAVLNALRAGRYCPAPPDWKLAIAKHMAARGPVCWPARTVAAVDFGEELPVTGPALGGAR